MNERPTLSLSADQVRADGEAFLITMRPRTYPNENVNSGMSLNVIPPGLVALINQPCPTCDGHGSGYAMQRGWGRAKQSACPDCGGSGRLVFDLVTVEHHKSGDDWTSHRVWLDPEWGILPITYEGEGDEWDAEGCGSPHVMIFTGMSAGVPTRRLILCDGANDPDTVVTDDVGGAPPAARPGDYVARAVRSDRTGAGTAPDTGDAAGSPSTGVGRRRTLGNGRVPQPPR